MKGEYLIPTIVDGLIQEQKANVTVLESRDKPVFTAKSNHKSRRNYYDSQHTPRVAGMKAAFVIRYRSIFILIAPSSYLSFILSY